MCNACISARLGRSGCMLPQEICGKDSDDLRLLNSEAILRQKQSHSSYMHMSRRVLASHIRIFFKAAEIKFPLRVWPMKLKEVLMQMSI